MTRGWRFNGAWIWVWVWVLTNIYEWWLWSTNLALIRGVVIFFFGIYCGIKTWGHLDRCRYKWGLFAFFFFFFWKYLGCVWLKVIYIPVFVFLLWVLSSLIFLNGLASFFSPFSLLWCGPYASFLLVCWSAYLLGSFGFHCVYGFSPTWMFGAVDKRDLDRYSKILFCWYYTNVSFFYVLYNLMVLL